MAINTITYSNKSDINSNSSVPAANKVQAADMNEIKTVVNANANVVGDGDNLVGASTVVDYLNGRTFRKILWTNNNPTSSFSPQTVNLTETLDNYDAYEIIFLQSTTAQRTFSTGVLPVGYGTIMGMVTDVPKWRPTAATVSGSSVDISNANYLNAGTVTADNTALIPFYIIGHKTGLY